jgi:hypothetical protein
MLDSQGQKHSSACVAHQTQSIGLLKRVLLHVVCKRYCRLAEVVANKLRLEEEEDYRRQGQQLEEEVSESARAMRDISAFQLVTQADGDQAQV